MIGLLGGTFNPPHLGHLREAALACSHLALERVVFMPANIPPHKELPEDTASPAERFEMISIAAKLLGFAEVSRLELEREGPSYTIDTVAELERIYPGKQIAIVCGSDMMVTLDSWRKGGELLKRCVVAAFARGVPEDASMREKAEEFKEKYGADIRLFYDRAIEISSSELRALIRAGSGEEFLPEGVLCYIREHNLYGT
jgi:nicotinate-nucleotide adenylyltransferase